jgi:hypothetical protein
MEVGQRIDCYNVKASAYVSAEGKDIGKTFISSVENELLFIPLSHSWDWSKGGLPYNIYEIKKVGTLIVKKLK